MALGIQALHKLGVMHRDLKVREPLKRYRVQIFSSAMIMLLRLETLMYLELLDLMAWITPRQAHLIMQVQRCGKINHMTSNQMSGVWVVLLTRWLACNCLFKLKTWLAFSKEFRKESTNPYLDNTVVI